MELSTLSKVFIDQVEKNKNKAFLIYKDASGQWQDVSWKEVGERVMYIAMGLVSLGVKNGDRISGISETKPDYAYCCTAVANVGAVFAPIYQTNSPSECAHVINDSTPRIIFTENRAQTDKILAAEKLSTPFEKIIVLDSSDLLDDERVISFEMFIQSGKAFLEKMGKQVYLDRIKTIQPEDLIYIIYTSGTTGPPKGVIDSHAGVIRNAEGYTKLYPLGDVDKERGMSFLPMAHALEERNGHWFHIIYGFTQVYPESIRTVFDTVKEMGVTLFFTTPRFFEKTYGQILAAIEKESPERQSEINNAIQTGWEYNSAKMNGETVTPELTEAYERAWDTFLKSVREKFGLQFRYSGLGGAPAAPEILKFFMSCGLPLYEGYGLTECCGMISTNEPRNNKIGTVGKPLAGIDVKIADDGELLCKGWLWSKGYWNNEKATKELFKDGWMNTGDLATMDEDGYLKITGRKKEIIITSGGKNVSPAWVENILKMSSFISQAVVFGEGKDYMVAIVTLNVEDVIEFAKEKGIQYSDYADLITKQPIIDLIQSEIDKKNKELSRAEHIRKFTILSEEFTQERGEVTPTFKVKRKNVTELYSDVVEAMYLGGK